MLRITLPTTKNPGVYVLEGRLTGLWVRELMRVVRAANDDDPAIFDLQEVFYVDSDGEEILQILSGLGDKFITESAYGKDLCRRLKLHRVMAFYVPNRRTRLEANSKLTHGIGTERAPSSHSSAAQQLVNTRDAESEG
jgi:hypothetical protein